ncbi:hypothetical protein QJS10_CPA07g00056 [Acorus calamus]|uniref:ubiquitinyl hydrolase 1 n=1 Tax=Acorus calamus TaxID=4465 RepID=A0AAV9EEG7_ACOCL|nr:hypothetical protein QJS10_CPA07g00056 [Acorus calamus]
MAGSSNQVLVLYHETHQSKLSAVQCVNAVLQGHFFSQRALMNHAFRLLNRAPKHVYDDIDVSHIVSLGGHFSLKVIQAALGEWGLRIVPVDGADNNPETENVFVCESQNRWVCVRRRVFAVRGELPDKLPDIFSPNGKWILPEDARRAVKSFNGELSMGRVREGEVGGGLEKAEGEEDGLN